MLSGVFLKPDVKRMIAACMTCPGGEYLYLPEALEILNNLRPETLAQMEQQIKENHGTSEVIKWPV